MKCNSIDLYDISNRTDIIVCSLCGERPFLYFDEKSKVWDCAHICTFCMYGIRGTLNALTKEQAIKGWNKINE